MDTWKIQAKRRKIYRISIKLVEIKEAKIDWKNNVKLKLIENEKEHFSHNASDLKDFHLEGIAML